MLRVIHFFALILLSMGAHAQASTHYVSDDVFTYIHGGPGTEFRIIGSVEAGQPITFNGKTEGDYSQIIDNKNREGWIRSDFVTDKPSFRTRFPEMEKELIQVNEQLNSISLNTDNAAQDLELANQKVTELQAALKTALTERDTARAKVNNDKDEQQFKMWQQGGIIAGIGALIGIILVYLPRPQRRKNSRWM
ncbi:TIGR04211 family SH3 domain-containing protein [Shewanella sp. ULN5]|uniref:TIGR04211 family SH3 domain-containing protein n=1 Tax=Shewanella sp. ULN5 TaxID=2994678 RepID=UPI00273DA366|nr:TIGR04211 family SH3 domain-containing protein [Shewanella sp. ULN5]MDP5147314.1 TIGR04211 family SH3 domain-containing protein [Shewanella sp. ULN5]